MRIRHAASRAYLYIDSSNIRIDVNSDKISFPLGLVKDPSIVSNDANDPTLFSFIPASDQDSRGVPIGSYLRIQHVATHTWLHATSIKESQLPPPPTSSSRSLALSLAPFPLTTQQSQPFEQQHHHENYNRDSIRYSTTDSYTNTPLSDIPTHQVSATPNFYYHDCFTVTLVSDHLFDSFNIVNECLPWLQDFLKKQRHPIPGESSLFPIKRSEFDSISNILVNKFLIYTIINIK